MSPSPPAMRERPTAPLWTQHPVARVGTWVLLAAGVGLVVYPFSIELSGQSRAALVLIGIAMMEGGGAVAMIRRGLVTRALSTPGSPRAYFLAVLLAAGFVAFTIIGNPYVRQHFLEIALVKLVAIPVAVGAAMLEEIIFRAFLMDQLQARGANAVVQVLLSGVAFGLAHFYAFGGLATAISAQLATMILGFGLAIVYLAAGRKLWPAIAAHGLVDLSIEPWLIAGFFR